MQFKKCPLCDNLKPLPFHITEVKDGKATENFSLCKECAEIYLEDTKGHKLLGEQGEGVLQPETPPENFVEEVVIDLAHIDTPEQLLDFIAAHEKMSSIPPCENCKLSWAEFDKVGRFGCPQCYDHFGEIIRPILETYHGDSYHVGKIPKSELEKPEEKRKTLKLKMARAVEYEDYELAAELKKELDLIDSSDLDGCQSDSSQCEC